MVNNSFSIYMTGRRLYIFFIKFLRQVLIGDGLISDIKLEAGQQGASSAKIANNDIFKKKWRFLIR